MNQQHFFLNQCVNDELVDKQLDAFYVKFNEYFILVYKEIN